MSEETILVAFSHDGKKYELEVEPERPISHLMDRIEELTDVPPANMKGKICITFTIYLSGLFQCEYSRRIDIIYKLYRISNRSNFNLGRLDFA